MTLDKTKKNKLKALLRTMGDKDFTEAMLLEGVQGQMGQLKDNQAVIAGVVAQTGMKAAKVERIARQLVRDVETGNTMRFEGLEKKFSEVINALASKVSLEDKTFGRKFFNNGFHLGTEFPDINFVGYTGMKITAKSNPVTEKTDLFIENTALTTSTPGGTTGQLQYKTSGGAFGGASIVTDGTGALAATNWSISDAGNGRFKTLGLDQVTLGTITDGRIEYNGTHFYVTIGTTRYQIDQQSGGTFVDNEVVSGSGSSFTLAGTPILGSQHIYGNGMRLTPGVDYTISGANITILGGVTYATGTLLADYRT